MKMLRVVLAVRRMVRWLASMVLVRLLSSVGMGS